ncbi:MAG: hypothetical protein QM741_06055 [Rudaea sp.]
MLAAAMLSAAGIRHVTGIANRARTGRADAGAARDAAGRIRVATLARKVAMRIIAHAFARLEKAR